MTCEGEAGWVQPPREVLPSTLEAARTTAKARKRPTRDMPAVACLRRRSTRLEMAW